MPVDITGQGDPERLTADARFQLDPKLPPGDYFLQVVVTDKLAKGNSRTASGWMDFEIGTPSHAVKTPAF